MIRFFYFKYVKYTKTYFLYLIYKNMKAKDVMKKFDISRNTLSNWVKKGYIKVEKTLSGRYIYIVEENKQKDDIK